MKKSTIALVVIVYMAIAAASIAINWWFIAKFGWIAWIAAQVGIILGQILLMKKEWFVNWYLGGMEKCFNFVAKYTSR